MGGPVCIKRKEGKGGCKGQGGRKKRARAGIRVLGARRARAGFGLLSRSLKIYSSVAN